MLDKKRSERLFKKQFIIFSELSAHQSVSRQPLKTDLYPCLNDNTSTTGFDRHYIYHPAWAARVLAKTAPKNHVDISSTLHFCTLVSAFIPTDFYDFRPAPLTLEGLSCKSANLMALDWESDSVESLSCMHVIEHIGLGRYGDPLDPSADIKAISELVRVLKPGGNLLVAVPVGIPRICFNAHRVYSHEEFCSFFIGLSLKEMALIPDGEVLNGYLINAERSIIDQQNYGCGCYWFTKPIK